MYIVCFIGFDCFQLSCVMDYPGLLCHTLEMHYVLLTYNLRLNYVEMLESVCPRYKHVNKGNSNVKQSFDHSVPARKSVPGVELGVINCQSISGKLDFVLDHIKEYQLDIVALTETWLSSEDSKNKHVIDQCVAHGYSLHHSPRTSGRRGGGVGLLVSNAIKVTFKRIHVSPLITSFELMEAVLTICSVSLRLIVIYRMPPPK